MGYINGQCKRKKLITINKKLDNKRKAKWELNNYIFLNYGIIFYFCVGMVVASVVNTCLGPCVASLFLDFIIVI